MKMRRPLLALLVASGLWGGAISGTKYGLRGFGPVTLLSVELVAATAVLWVALLVRGYRPPRRWWLPALLGLLEPALAYLGDTVGLSMTSAVNGALLNGLESALVVVLAALLLRESITPAAALAVTVAAGGLLVLAGAGGGRGSTAGDLFVAGGVLSASLYTIVAKRFGDDSDALSLTTWQFTVATLVTLGVSAAAWGTGSESLPAAVAPRFWLAAALVGVAGFGISFLLFNTVISRVDAGQAAVVLNLIPVFALLSAVMFLGEGVTRSDAIGAVLVGASVLYFTIADRREAASDLRVQADVTRPAEDARENALERVGN
jgi:O-acetylserine/cysteine efflux transporter